MNVTHRLMRALMTMAFLAGLEPVVSHAQPARLPEPLPLLPSAGAATRPANASGRLLIRAVQGTANASAPAGNDVTIRFQGAGQKIGSVPMRLDERGTAELTGIPLTRMPVVPLVIVKHAGVSYHTVGKPMDIAHADQQLEVAVYEVTERPPEWCMPTRRVVLSRVPEGLRVTEALTVENPTDRTWVNSRDSAGHRPTVAMPLPQGAQGLQFAGGFAPGLTHFDGKMLRHSAPLAPGISQYQVSYTLPSAGAQTMVPITAPTSVHELSVVVADDGSPVSLSGLEAAGVADAQGGKARQFSAKELKPGQVVSITLATDVPLSAAAAAEEEPSVVPKVIAGAVLVGSLVAASLVMFLRSTRPGKAECCGKCDHDHRSL